MSKDILKKEISKLSYYLNNYVQNKIDEDIEVEISTFSGAFCHEKIVVLGLISKLNENDIDNFHKQYYELNFPDLFHENTIEYETFAFFHEIGHIMIFNPKKEKKYQRQVKKIKKRIEKNNNIMTINDLMEYFTLENEKLADLWAYDFISSNLFSVVNFQSFLMDGIKNIINLADE